MACITAEEVIFPITMAASEGLMEADTTMAAVDDITVVEDDITVDGVAIADGVD